MLRLRLLVLFGCVLGAAVGCKPPGGPEPTAPGTDAGPQTETLAEARAGFTTDLARRERAGEPVDEPPPNLFRRVQYDSPVGQLAAYLTPDPKDGKKRPAIVWITGGDCNTIGDVWSPKPPSNDQTARQYREAGIVMMFPSLRGGNENPGFKENFYGEVDDVLAAAKYLARQDHVDPDRIYLGGHSTGGTLVLLVAEVPNPFRAVFSFGPVGDITGYGGQFTEAVRTADPREVALRNPGRWLHSIRCPTFVFEGTARGNLAALESMAADCKNPQVHFHPVAGANHFSVLAPVNRIVAKKVLADTGAATTLGFTASELRAPFGG